MKKRFLFLFSCLVALNVQAQYRHCLDDDIVRWSFLDYHIIDAGRVSTEIGAYGDTLINDYVYKKMYYLEEFNPFDVSEDNEKWKNLLPVLPIDEHMRIYIRENEDASKMYIYDAVQKTEYLIFDMNLQEGDTLTDYPGGFYGEVRNYVVESVYIKNGLKHIYLVDPNYYYGLSQTITFIESVGPSVWYLFWGFYESFLNCFQNQSVFYKNEETDEFDGVCPCGYRWSSIGIKEPITNNFTVVVNQEQIKIFFLENETGYVSLYDLSGQLWYSRQLSSNECVIETEAFPKGTYLLKVFYTDKNEMSVNKIIRY